MAVGMAITHGGYGCTGGCRALFPLIPTGTKVWIINEPVKVPYIEGELLLEVHPPVDAEWSTTASLTRSAVAAPRKGIGNSHAAIHWD